MASNTCKEIRQWRLTIIVRHIVMNESDFRLIMDLPRASRPVAALRVLLSVSDRYRVRAIYSDVRDLLRPLRICRSMLRVMSRVLTIIKPRLLASILLVLFSVFSGEIEGDRPSCDNQDSKGWEKRVWSSNLAVLSDGTSRHCEISSIGMYTHGRRKSVVIYSTTTS